jgi:hypothetical protein
MHQHARRLMRSIVAMEIKTSGRVRSSEQDSTELINKTECGNMQCSDFGLSSHEVTRYNSNAQSIGWRN